MNFDDFTPDTKVAEGLNGKVEANSHMGMLCKHIIIPEGIEEIGGWAFCWSFADSAIIPSTVMKINENPFPHTHIYKLTCLSPKYSVKDDILIENDTMRLVSFVGKDKNSGKDLFKNNDDRDDNIRYEYVIPSYIKILGEGCFRGRNLDKVVIPENVEIILQNPFCYSGIQVENHSPYYKLENGLLWGIRSKDLISYIGKEEDIVVPEGIEIIECSTFELLEYGVNSITLPSSIKEIRGNFAEECGLKHVFVPIGMEEYFQGLIPKYKDIIKPIGYKEPKIEAEVINKIDEELQRKDVNEEIKEKEVYKPNYALLSFMFIFCGIITGGITYLAGCLCSWNFSISEWNWFSIIVSGILGLLSLMITIGAPLSVYINEKEAAQRRKVKQQNEPKDSESELISFVKNSGGITNVFGDIIEALGYSIIEEGDVWIKLRLSESSYLKLEQRSWNRQMVTYYINENGKSIEQRQSFKTMGYMPMVVSREEIIQTIKEKIWNFGLAEKPQGNAKSKNTYSEIACLFRDIYVIAHKNEGRITKKTTDVIKSIAQQKHVSEEQLSRYRGWDGNPSAFILDCYPQYEGAKERYLKDITLIYSYTLKKNSSKEAYIYLCEIASKLGKTEDELKKYI